MRDHNRKGLAFGVGSRWRFYQSGGQGTSPFKEPTRDKPPLRDERHEYDEIFGMCRHCALDRIGHSEKQARLK